MRGFLRFSMAVLAWTMPAMAQNPVGNQTAQNPATANINRRAARRARQPAEPSPAPVELPSETPIVTLKGVCDAAEKSDSPDCKTVITRGQIDRIVARVAPGAPQASKPQFAIEYARILAAAKLAVDRKLEDNPVVAAELEKKAGPARAEVLAKAFYRQVEEEAENASNDELQQYYAAHASNFEEGEVLRLSLPISGNLRNGMRLSPAMVKTEAEALRTRAAAGFDFDQLEVQAYRDFGITLPPPLTRLTIARRSSMPEDQGSVFDLQPGEITPVIESYGKLVILKLVSKHTATFESVLPEIKPEVKRERLGQEMAKASKSVTADFNLQYLGITDQPALFTVTGDAPSLAHAAASLAPDSRRRAVARRPAASTRVPTPTKPPTP
jgi:PPIC-type PPIASE domain